MNARRSLSVAMLGLMLSPPALLGAQKATAELWEGTVRQIYIDKPLIGARGYLVSNLEKGQARVEVSGFPQRDLGYEVFLFEIDVPPYVNLLFKDGNPNKGLNDPAASLRPDRAADQDVVQPRHLHGERGRGWDAGVRQGG